MGYRAAQRGAARSGRVVGGRAQGPDALFPCLWFPFCGMDRMVGLHRALLVSAPWCREKKRKRTEETEREKEKEGAINPGTQTLSLSLSVCVSLSLFLSLSHTHTHTHKHHILALHGCINRCFVLVFSCIDSRSCQRALLTFSMHPCLCSCSGVPLCITQQSKTKRDSANNAVNPMPAWPIRRLLPWQPGVSMALVRGMRGQRVSVVQSRELRNLLECSRYPGGEGDSTQETLGPGSSYSGRCSELKQWSFNARGPS